ncbi:MAG: HAD family hydrolase [Hormoscilla sp. GM102CHS1]|nr:HAD family hydrolase [Hormoscilla sp. GM102CHS1]
MPETAPTILALDFDGVLCDGLQEYFLTTWRTYCQVWQPASQDPPDRIALVFYRLRPVIETGWEMPLLLRAILQGVPEEEILLGWLAIAQQLLKTENLQAAELGPLLDKQRDRWISTDLAGWLGYHRFYPGVVERVRSLFESPVEPVIITTKEERFVRKLLQQQGIEFSQGKIYGKGCKRPKYEILRELGGAVENIWFIEDRLKTLQLVQQQPDLEQVRLYLADWGYNTSSERESVCNQERIKLLSLEQFVQDFSAWP